MLKTLFEIISCTTIKAKIVVGKQVVSMSRRHVSSFSAGTASSCATKTTKTEALTKLPLGFHYNMKYYTCLFKYTAWIEMHNS